MSLKKTLETKFLPFVIKPGRYIGNELGAFHKDDPDLTRMAIAFPDKYEIGMSHLGLQIVYGLVNKLDFALCERVFAPDIDAEARLKNLGIPLFSLESARPLREFDLIGFTLSYELGFTNLLNMLNLAGIPLQSGDRNESDPIICAGGPVCFNPEPLADFIDFFFVGDVEESIADILQIIKRRKESGRYETLRQLAQLPGVYVPSFYQPGYDDNGQFAGLERIESSAPETVHASVVEEIRPEYYPEQPLVPFEEITHDRLSLEIMRGCGHGCRFCQAGVIYRPKRDRDVAAIVDQAVRDLKNTGYDEVTLLSLSSSDYKHLDQLVPLLVESLQGKHVRTSLPSLRPTMKSLQLAKLISPEDKPTLTFALEGGTEKMRQVANKQVSIEEFYQVVTSAFQSGWKLIKLYFMIGLPGETEEDVLGIVDVIKKCERIGREARGRVNLNVTISPFSPKAHTPWQWEEQYSVERVHRTNDLIRRSHRGRVAQIKTRHGESAVLEGVLGRGDRRLGQVINRAYELGARFDGWSEHFDFSLWEQAFSDCQIDMTRYLRQRDPDEPLPWDHIDKGVSKEWLLRERQRSHEVAEMPEPVEAAFKLADLMVEAPEPIDEILTPPEAKQRTYGRQPRWSSNERPLSVPRSRMRLQWSKDSSARFHAHLVTIRVFERAIRRAELPVSYSQGFHPHQKLSFGPPLSLGYTSLSEYLDIQLDSPFTNEMINSLNYHLPQGFSVLQGKPLAGKGASLSSLINIARYDVLLSGTTPIDQSMIDKAFGRDSIVVKRRRKEQEREFDIRKAIIALKKREDDHGSFLLMELAMGDLGFVRPEEVLSACFGLNNEDILSLPVCRTDLLVYKNGRRLTPFEVE